MTANDYLHSNMVRFIIQQSKWNKQQQENIYIPIWLDLLSIITFSTVCHNKNLHSNMVRFIIQKFGLNIWSKPKFTFQYG